MPELQLYNYAVLSTAYFAVADMIKEKGVIPLGCMTRELKM